MIEKHFDLCTEIAADLQEVRQIWVPSKNLSYIETNQGELIFFSSQFKYQVLGKPSVRLDENFLKDMNVNAKILASEISEQMARYKEDKVTITTSQEWLAHVDAFMSMIDGKCKSLNEAYIWRVEIQMWVELLENQSNPIFQDLAIFLKCHLNSNEDLDGSQDNHHCRELLESEIESANQLAEYLLNHSNDVLREAAERVTEWIASH